MAALTVAVPPAITNQPQSQTVVAGANVSFAVAASGSAPLTYQWCFNGANLVGATATNYSITGVQPAHAGNYTVIVTNLAGSATSAVAALTVTVSVPIQVSATLQGDNLVLSWKGGLAPFQLQTAPSLADAVWENLDPATTNRSFSISRTNNRSFYRILGK